MKHEIPDEIIANSEPVQLARKPTKLSCRERLELWAKALERHSGPLSALRRLEHLSPDQLRAYRGDNTPLTVAFHDPVLRAAGLPGDRLGDAMEFFELSDRDAHRLFCDCHYNGAMTGTGLAKHVRRHIRSSERRAMWARAFRKLLGVTA
jgi:hypothetical protein